MTTDAEYLSTVSNPNHLAFAHMILPFPFIRECFDFDEGICHVEKMEDRMGVLSHGERVLMEFCAAVWFNENRYKFDMFEAVSILDIDYMQVIHRWLSAPFWP